MGVRIMPDARQPIQRMRLVLVVEDDLELADLLAEVLVFENCTPEVVSNGMEALEKLRATAYDAVICDLMMPRIDGQALYEEVARHMPYMASKFLFITGQASRKSGYSDFIYQTGNRLLEKPFEMDELRSALHEIFERD
jgi:two-component system, cell cycle sensor histidine kinase and response regulator CckA